MWYNRCIEESTKEMSNIGSVQVDVGKAERQFDLVTFSDFECVKGLIKNRSIVDYYRGIEIDRNPFRAGDVRPMNPEMIALFVSLDDLLEKCHLNIKQRFVIDRLMDGYTEQDVADIFKQDVSQITKTLNRVSTRVVDINDREWKYDFLYMEKMKAPFVYKVCTKCRKTKPMTMDFYYTDDLAKDGFKNKCRSCVGGK